MSIKPYSILLIDDDMDFCDLLTEYLSGAGFHVYAVHDGLSGCEAAVAKSFDIIILDVMLPKMNGFDVLKRIKSTIETPVLMLTAKGEEVDQVIGLEIGADDYLPKPCSPRLLVARLKAILRRTSEHEEPKESGTYIADDITINHEKHEAMLSSSVLELTNSEYKILLCLVKSVGKVVTKEELSEKGLNKKIEAYDRSVDMHISHLRNKLGTLTNGAPRIKTIRGIGYLLEKLA